MANTEKRPGEQSLNEMLRRALSTPPISNEDILKRSKESHGKAGHPK